jgi:hypothetical protein
MPVARLMLTDWNSTVVARNFWTSLANTENLQQPGWFQFGLGKRCGTTERRETFTCDASRSRRNADRKCKLAIDRLAIKSPSTPGGRGLEFSAAKSPALSPKRTSSLQLRADYQWTRQADDQD